MNSFLFYVTPTTAFISAIGIMLALMSGLSNAPRWHRIPLGVSACGILGMATLILVGRMESPWFLTFILIEHIGLIALGLLQFIKR